MDGSFVLVLLGFLASIAIVLFIWWILQVVANWLIFTKAGEKGWKSIIPIYADYITFKISWKKGKMMFWVWLIGNFLMSYGYYAQTDAQAMGVASNPVIGLVSVIGTLAAFVITVLLALKKSQAFGHGAGFAIGLLFLSPIFTMILGFGSSFYQGPQE
ncbi:MAG: DUF5684 domain-containing protein [Eubacteriales bacterium]|nr:DUF5684 domain-containing protein [Eubacteriales bacterium]